MKIRSTVLLASAVCVAMLAAAATAAWWVWPDRLAAFLGHRAAIVLASDTSRSRTGRVLDRAHILPTSAVQRLEDRLARFETDTKHQFVIVTVPSLDGKPIESYALGLANRLGIGRRGYDDGVLLVVAPNERKVRIEVGRGLEKILTNRICADIIAQQLIPAFRKGEFPAGMERGAAAIIAHLSR